MRYTRAMIALAAVLGLALQADGGAAQVRGGMGGMQQQGPAFRVYALAGWAPLDVDALNERLASLPEPYSPVAEDMVVVGGGLHARMDRILLGGEFGVLVSTEDAEFADERRAQYSGYYGALTAGFSIIQTRGLDIYPLIQAGGGGGSLEVTERGAPDWDDVLADPGRSATLSTFGFYGAGGLGMDYVFRGGFMFGVRGTWAYTPDSDNWSDEEGEMLDGPDIDLSGPSVRLLVGFGGLSRR